MTVINKSMNVSELNIQPPLEGKIRLSDDMQQTLALLTAMGSDRRRPLRCSESGVLNVTDPRIKDIKHYTQADTVYEYTGGNLPCTGCLVMGHPDNAGIVWVRPNTTATVNNSWPLAVGEVMGFTLDNLEQLNMLFVEDGDILIVAYTR